MGTDGQIYGKWYSFPMFDPKLIFSLVAFNPFVSIPAVVLFSCQRESG